MAERLTVVVTPSAAHPDLLTVQDAMRHVLDIFELASAEQAEPVLWRLVHATTNSPFRVEAESASPIEGVDVSLRAREQKALLARGLSELASGNIIPEWEVPSKRERVARIMRRNQNGVGKTDIIVDPQKPAIIVTPQLAQIGTRALERHLPEVLELKQDRARKEMGSMEGTLTDITTHYDQPALKVRERKSKTEIIVRISERMRDQIAKQIGCGDVWDHKQVVVRGKISFNKAGAIQRVDAQSVEFISRPTVRVEDIRDPSFTGGLTVSEYLDRLREGELG